MNEADEKADISTLDKGESPASMELLLLREGAKRRGEMLDRTVELAQKAASLRRALPESLLSSLATLVRAMNCYYSNLIEGHNTHPVDIERALRADYSNDPGTRDLQREARAHVAVQLWIDEGGLRERALTSDWNTRDPPTVLHGTTGGVALDSGSGWRDARPVRTGAMA
jgi:hypothetical protein